MKLSNFYKLASLFIFSASLTLPLSCEALTFSLPQGDNTIVGEVSTIQSKPGDTLRLLARRYDIGFQEMHSANPTILSDQRLLPGTRITIPGQFILPPKPWKGLVVNLSAYRIFYFPEDMPVVITFPMGIGKVGWNTPTFEGMIVKKAKDPSWHPPLSVKQSTLETMGIVLPPVIEPSPRNPLGQYAFYTSLPSYELHGTNYPYGVGDQVSAGCLRMLPEDVEQLYYSVPVKTPLRVFHQAIDFGILNQQIYMELHPKQQGIPQESLPLSDTTILSTLMLYSAQNNISIDWDKVYQVIYQSKLNSIPVDISLNKE